MSNTMWNQPTGMWQGSTVTGQEPAGAMLSDHIIASDLLNSAKTGVRNLAYAITETHSPQARRTLEQHLGEAIQFHERVASYMVSKGYYQPNNLQEQMRIDLDGVQQVLRMQG